MYGLGRVATCLGGRSVLIAHNSELELLAFSERGAQGLRIRKRVLDLPFEENLAISWTSVSQPSRQPFSRDADGNACPSMFGCKSGVVLVNYECAVGTIVLTIRLSTLSAILDFPDEPDDIAEEYKLGDDMKHSLAGEYCPYDEEDTELTDSSDDESDDVTDGEDDARDGATDSEDDDEGPVHLNVKYFAWAAWGPHETRLLFFPDRTDTRAGAPSTLGRHGLVALGDHTARGQWRLVLLDFGNWGWEPVVELDGPRAPVLNARWTVAAEARGPTVTVPEELVDLGENPGPDETAVTSLAYRQRVLDLPLPIDVEVGDAQLWDNGIILKVRFDSLAIVAQDGWLTVCHFAAYEGWHADMRCAAPQQVRARSLA